jgi:hypothetical protein
MIYLSPSHTGSYDFLIVRLMAIWPWCDQSQRLLRSQFAIAYCDCSYDRWQVIVRLVVRVVVRSPTIVRLVVAISNLSHDQSWRPATARTIVRPYDRWHHQSPGGRTSSTTNRVTTRDHARLVVRPCATGRTTI